jgi:hypothetical protein
MAQAQALIAQAQGELQDGEQFFQRHGAAARQAFLRASHEPEDELERFVIGQLSLARQQPALPAKEIEIDAATRFARRMNQRRVIV